MMLVASLLTFLTLNMSDSSGVDQQASLTDFRIELEWLRTDNMETIQNSNLYRWFESLNGFLYVCSHSSFSESLKNFSAKPPVVTLIKGDEVAEIPNCLCLSGFTGDGVVIRNSRTEHPCAFLNGMAPQAFRNYRTQETGEHSVKARFSATKYFRDALKSLNVKNIGDARLVMTLWRKGSSIVADNVAQMVAAEEIDLFKFTSKDSEPYQFNLDTKAFLGNGNSAQARLQGRFSVLHVADTSPFYDLNVPLEVYRPTVLRTILKKADTSAINLQDYLNLGNLYFGFQKEAVWPVVLDRTSRINFNADEIKAFLANDRVVRMAALPVNEALNVYLYYFRANLEDVEMRLVSIEEKLKADQANGTYINGQIVLSNEAQEALARYQLNRDIVRDSLKAFEIVTGAGRAYLDEVLR